MFRKRRFRALQQEYAAAEQAGDADREKAALDAITAGFPEVSWGWYDRGLRAKWDRDWPTSRDTNLRALELLDDPRQSPEAWNLGIAATALGDWPTARRAWAAYGVTVDPDGAGPVVGDFGPGVVRLNPDPRFHERELLVDGRRGATETVWMTRIDPARGRLLSVPTPETGHRWGDVVLHDGDPVGHRRLGERTVSVFNQIALLERGEWPTLAVDVPVVGRDAVEELHAAFSSAGYAAECWTTELQVLCRACSEGLPDGEHDHEPAADATRYRVGLAAPLPEAGRLLDAWAAAGTGRDHGPLEETS